jgi:hypothetical protein
MDRDRDIDYAAAAVGRALAEKFSRSHSLNELQVTANERTILVRDGQRTAEGTRDNLLAAVRNAGTYENFWEGFSSSMPQQA